MAMVITLIVNITANWILIPWLGMQGAAIAMGLSALTMGVSTILLARRILGIRLFF